MKQTAVEFLIDTWVKTGTLKGEDMFQATQMEKEQIINAYIKGFCNKDITAICNEDIRAKQYYYETFNPE